MDSGCGEVSSAGLYPSTSSDLNEKSLKKTIPKFIYFVNIYIELLGLNLI
jgi:hypothetical protein